MIIIAGLGNPGREYQKTPHNIGRIILDDWRNSRGFSDFRLQKKFNSLVSKNNFENKNIILALPETFMNESGKALNLLAKNYKVPTENLWVIHDDSDLPLGKIKISKNRGSAGHKGVASIIKELGTKNFIRFRIGIRPPEIKKIKNLKNFVLQRFSKKEEEIFKEIIEKTKKAIETSLSENLEKAMQEIN